MEGMAGRGKGSLGTPGYQRVRRKESQKGINEVENQPFNSFAILIKVLAVATAPYTSELSHVLGDSGQRSYRFVHA